MWTEKQSNEFKTPNFSKEFFRKPVILKLLGDIDRKNILELGCGSGYWTRLLAKKGAKCTGIDSSKEQLKIAKEREGKNPLGIKYLKKNITNLRGIGSGSFDIVFIEFVLLEIPKLSMLKKIFEESYRVLKKGGILFISDMHPFDPIVHNRFKLQKGFHYFKSGNKMTAFAKQLDGSMISFVDYHWTLENYISSITSAGFVITQIKEPRPSESMIKKTPYLEYRKNLPKDIIIIGKKL